MRVIPFILISMFVTQGVFAQADASLPPAGIRANSPMPPVTGRGTPDEFDTPPHLISGNAPIYPITRLRKGIDGEATITFTIAEDGTTKDFSIDNATYSYFGSHAVVAVQEWRFHQQ